MQRFTLMTGLLGLSLVVTACSTPSADLCARRDECRAEENVPGDNDDSDDGEDDVAVCAAFSQGLMDALRANAEPECREYADAVDNTTRCQVSLDCDDLISGETDACEDEQETADDICERIAQERINCETLFGSICSDFGGEGEGEGEENTGCDFEDDGICDDSTGTGDCDDGTDLADCA